MMESGKPRTRRQLSPEEKWEVLLEVTSQQLTQADAARKWNVDVSTVIRVRQLAKDAALAAFAASKPGRMPSPEQAELEAALAEMGYPFRSGRASCALVRSGSLSPRTGNHGAESGAPDGLSLAQERRTRAVAVPRSRPGANATGGT